MNQLLIMADEYLASVLGVDGHRVVKTPHLDSLSAAGAIFDNPYTSRPICVPTRAAFQCGR